MSRMLDNIDKNHILQAIERFDKEGLPNPNAYS